MSAFIALWLIGSVQEYLDQQGFASAFEVPRVVRVARIVLWPVFTVICAALVMWDACIENDAR